MRTWLFVSGPGFWRARPGLWLLLVVAALSLPSSARGLGWGALSVVLLLACDDYRRWRRHERRRIRTTSPGTGAERGGSNAMPS